MNVVTTILERTMKDSPALARARSLNSGLAERKVRGGCVDVDAIELEVARNLM